MGLTVNAEDPGHSALGWQVQRWNEKRDRPLNMAPGKVTRRPPHFKLTVNSDRRAWVVADLSLRVTILIHEHEAEGDSPVGLTPRDTKNESNCCLRARGFYLGPATATDLKQSASNRCIVTQHHVRCKAGLHAFWFIHHRSLNNSHMNDSRTTLWA